MAESRHLIFKLGGLLYALPLQKTKHIQRLRDLTRLDIAETPDWCLGGFIEDRSPVLILSLPHLLGYRNPGATHVDNAVTLHEMEPRIALAVGGIVGINILKTNKSNCIGFSRDEFPCNPTVVDMVVHWQDQHVAVIKVEADSLMPGAVQQNLRNLNNKLWQIASTWIPLSDDEKRLGSAPSPAQCRELAKRYREAGFIEDAERLVRRADQVASVMRTAIMKGQVNMVTLASALALIGKGCRTGRLSIETEHHALEMDFQDGHLHALGGDMGKNPDEALAFLDQIARGSYKFLETTDLLPEQFGLPSTDSIVKRLASRIGPDHFKLN